MIKVKKYIRGSFQGNDFLVIENNNLVLEGQCYSFSSLSFSKKKEDKRYWIYLPDGIALECETSNELIRFMQNSKQDSIKNQRIYFIKKSIMIFSSVVIILLILYVSLSFFLPTLSKNIAMGISDEKAYSIGEDTLKSLDEMSLKPSNLSLKRQASISKYFDKIVGNIEGVPKLQLVFRSSETLGANAFSLPNGTIVLLDELFFLTEDNEEIMSIIGHEIGHIKYRHGLRMLLESSILYGGLIVITGDVTSLFTLVSLLPVILMQHSYSRMAENEADEYALAFMKKNNIKVIKFMNILTKITASHDKLSKEENEEGFSDYLRSHPKTKERIARFN